MILFSSCSSEFNRSGLNAEKGRYLEYVHLDSSPYPGDTFAMVDKYPVKEKELKDFAGRQIQTGHTSHASKGKAELSPIEILPAFVEHYALVKEAFNNGLHTERSFARKARLIIWGGQTLRYLRYRGENAELDPAAITENLPSKWVKMNFQIRVYRTMEEALTAYEIYKSGISFDNLPGSLAISGRKGVKAKMPETGLVFPGSGFFEPIHDDYLFTLQEGDVPEPMKTGIGAAIVKILKRHDLADKEKEDILRQTRKKLTDNYIYQIKNKIIDGSRIDIYEDVLHRAFQGETTGKDLSGELVARVNDVPVTYGDYKELSSLNLSYLLKQVPEKNRLSVVLRQLKGFLGSIAVGIYASSRNFDPGEGFEASVRNRLWKILSANQRIRILENIQTEVSEEEAVSFYNANHTKFTVDDSVDVEFYFTPNPKDIQFLWDRYSGGVKFEDLSELDRPGGDFHGQKKYRLRKQIAIKGKNPLGDIEDLLFELPIGEVRVIDLPLGYYMARVVKKRKAGVSPFSDVKKQIVADLESGKRGNEFNKILKGLSSKISVKAMWHNANEGQPDKNPMDLG